MAIAFIRASAQSLGSSGGTSTGIDTTGATLVVVSVTATAGTIPTPTTNGSGTRASITKQVDGEPRTDEQIWYWWGSGVGTGSHTFTLSAAGGSFIAISILAFSGTDTSADPLDQHTSAATGSGTTGQGGSITPSTANQVVISGTSLGITSTYGSLSINGGFAATSVDFTGGASYPSGIAYLIQTSAAAANPTWTSGNNAAWAITNASFKAGSGGGGGTNWGQMLSQRLNRIVLS